MPTGEPVLGSDLTGRGLLGHDLENSNASTRHPRTLSPPPDDRRNPSLNPPAAWDICPDSRATYHLGHMS
jgi:hypothetical protein